MSRQLSRATVAWIFGKTVRILRERVGYSQESLAAAAGIDRSYMGNLERGMHCPALDTIFKLLPVLAVSFTQFAQEFEAIQRGRRRQ
jgi:XRE family transcriptional regulator, regulator of sulfur utilization